MSITRRFGLPLGVVAFSVFTGIELRAAEEPPGDLHPLPPVKRTLSDNNRQFQHMFQINGSSMAFSADARSLFMSGHMGLIFWNLEDPKSSQPRNLRLDNFFFHNAGVALAPDGKMIAAVSSMGGEQDMPIRFIDSATGKDIRQIENDQRIQGLCFSPDGRSLALVTPQRIELWDVATGDEIRVFPATQNIMYRLLTFSPDGKMLASVTNPQRFTPADAEEEDAEIHVWETASGKERACVRLRPPLPPLPQTRNRRAFYVNRGINSLAFSVDGRFLAIGGNDSTVHMWDLHRDTEAVPLTGFEGNVAASTFTPDGKELIALSFNSAGPNSTPTRLSWRMEEIRQMNSLSLAPRSDSAFSDLWQELAQSDVFRVYRAGRHLLTDPKRAVSLLADRLKPVAPGDGARLVKLVADLKNPNPAVRRKAMMELRDKHGEAAVGALRLHSDPQRRAFGVTFEQKLANQYNTPERARDLRAVRVLEQIGTPEARHVLEKLAKGAAGVNLTVASKAALDRLTAAKATPSASSSDDPWNDLGSDDAARAYRAIRRLSTEPGQAVSLLAKRMKPVPVMEEKELTLLLIKLDADDFQTREQANEALETAGEQAVPVLQKALDGKPTLEARKRIEHLLERLTKQTPPGALKGVRAVEVLEHIGSADAKHLLLSLSGGAPQAQITREAKASLERLARR